MKEETVRQKYIEGLEDIKNRSNIAINNLEMLLSEMKKEQKELIYTLMNLKSKVKNDEREK